MASGTPLPEFESGQRLLAADFAALVDAVRALGGAGSPVLRVWRQGRVFRPFHRAGAAMLSSAADGTTQLATAEMLWQLGENVTLLPDAPAVAVPDPTEERGLTVHATINFERSGSAGGETLRALSYETQATVPDDATENEDGSLDAPAHGAHELCALGGADARGRRQAACCPWVQPQRPCLAFRMDGWGQQALLPAPACTQVLAYHTRQYKEHATEYRLFLARLDKDGMMHVMANKRDFAR